MEWRIATRAISRWASGHAWPSPRPSPPIHRSRFSTNLLAVASLIGVAALLSPFWLTRAQPTGADRTAHGSDAPLLFAIVGVLCLGVLLIEAGGGADPDAKRVALLGVLVATNAALRLVPG